MEKIAEYQSEIPGHPLGQTPSERIYNKAVGKGSMLGITGALIGAGTGGFAAPGSLLTRARRAAVGGVIGGTLGGSYGLLSGAIGQSAGEGFARAHRDPGYTYPAYGNSIWGKYE